MLFTSSVLFFKRTHSLLSSDLSNSNLKNHSFGMLIMHFNQCIIIKITLNSESANQRPCHRRGVSPTLGGTPGRPRGAGSGGTGTPHSPRSQSPALSVLHTA